MFGVPNMEGEASRQPSAFAHIPETKSKAPELQNKLYFCVEATMPPWGVRLILELPTNLCCFQARPAVAFQQVEENAAQCPIRSASVTR